MSKTYKEAITEETETTINVLYGEKILSLYTNKVDLQRKLNKILGEPTYEHKKGKNIMSSRWDIPLSEKSKISQIMLKADIFEIMN